MFIDLVNDKSRLSEAQRLIKTRQISRLRFEETVCRAEVSGFSVSVIFEHGQPVITDCTCRRPGCVHILAVLCTLDDLVRRGRFPRMYESASKVFTMPCRSAGRYFDLSRIAADVHCTSGTRASADFYLSNALITERGIEEGYFTDLDSDVCGGSATLRARYGVAGSTVRLLMDKDIFLQADCSCGYCGYPNLCGHAVAALARLDQYIAEHDPGDITSYSTGSMLTELGLVASNALVPADEDDEEKTLRSLSLVPRLTRESGRLYLGAKVGSDRTYVLKDPAEFVAAYREGGRFIVGSGTELDLSRAELYDTSYGLFRLIEQCVEGSRLSNAGDENRNDHTTSVRHGAHEPIIIEGSRLDDLFDLYSGCTVEYNDKDDAGRKGQLVFSNGDPEPQLTILKITSSDGTPLGVTLTGDIPPVFRGASYMYWIADGSLSRMSPECGKVMEILDRSRDDEDKLRLDIGMHNLSAFYYTVLPVIRRYADVREPHTAYIETYLPPEAKFTFYLDMLGGVPLCQIIARYDEAAFTVRSENDFTSDSCRDAMKEDTARRTVLKYFPSFDSDMSCFVCEEDNDAVYKVLSEGISALEALGEVMGTDHFGSVKVRNKVKIDIGVSVKSDVMDLDIKSDLSQEELLDVIKSYKLKKKYHRLSSGDFVKIGKDIGEIAEIKDALRLSDKDFIKGKALLPAVRALYLDKAGDESGSLTIKRDNEFRRLVKNFKTVDYSDFEVPSSLDGIMREYQKFGYKWMRTLASCGFSGILADDMGLGKTLQMISVLLAEKEEGTKGTSLIVSPASLIYNWFEEIKKFAPSLDVCVVSGPQRERAMDIAGWTEHDVLITSYDLLKRDISYYNGKEFLYNVLDEAQYIKNDQTAAARTVKQLKSRHRFALTGTPVENRLSELWSIFDFLMPDYLFSYAVFKQEYELPIVKKEDKEAEKRLRRLVAPFILRRMREEVLKDLPEKIEEVRYALFDEDQRNVYDGEVTRMKTMLESQSDVAFSRDKLFILAELTRIRRICCDPSLVFENYTGTSAKRTALSELLAAVSESGHRALVFSQFTSMLDLIAEDLRRDGIQYFTLTGETPRDDRLDLVRRFNDGNVPVFLISLKAGGTGLNLTGADTVIHCDPWWNLAAQDQATSRAHRMGQKKTVSVYKLIAKDTIEEKIQSMQEKKKELADAIISGEGAALNEMTRHDLIELLDGGR